jgi:O-acetyl-ADP-ribose deacetylase (regulator of RNase III)
MPPVISLHTFDPNMATAWAESFGAGERVEIIEGNILDGSSGAVVSPANSFGYMDGGIDLAYRNFFGMEIQRRVQAKIRAEHHGELPVGQAIVVATDHAKLPLGANSIESLHVPALGTGVGAMPIGRAARQMAAAYESVFSNTDWHDDPARILVHHANLRS